MQKLTLGVAPLKKIPEFFPEIENTPFGTSFIATYDTHATYVQWSAVYSGTGCCLKMTMCYEEDI